MGPGAGVGQGTWAGHVGSMGGRGLGQVWGRACEDYQDLDNI